ncbi:MAG: hypothetical protein KBA81_05745, partial [Rhabdochlamydiaceae bacterium]|nr:hypothetical protein [Rhabdochlamydiaceae bacterium]
MSGVSNSHMNSTSNYLPYQMMGNRQVVQKWDKNSIAEHLWKDPGAPIEDEIVNKVNIAKTYVEGFGHVLQGVEADGDCFFSAFLESYRMLSRQIPILNDQEDKVTYLRSLVAEHINQTNLNRSLEIRKKGQWISSGEGEFLAKALSIHIRIITVNLDQDGSGLDDVIIFPDVQKPSKQWGSLTETEKPDEYIFIVDLGGHFIWAKNPNQVSSFSTPLLIQRDLQSDNWRSSSEDFVKKRSFSDSSIYEDHPAKQTRFGDDEERDEKASMLLAMEECLPDKLKKKTLSFYNQQITDRELVDIVIPKLLAQGEKLVGVRVDLRFNKITAKGIGYLVKIPCLTNLDISYNSFGDEGAIVLAKSMTLKKLEVTSCGIGKKAAWAFVSNTSLVDGLHLPGTELGSEWNKKINQQFKNNKARTNQQFAKKLQERKVKETLEKQVMQAIEKKRTDLLPNLVANLEGGVNTKLKYGLNLLTYALKQNSIECVQALLKMGAKLEDHE